MLQRNAKSLISTMKYFQTPQPDKIEQSVTLQIGMVQAGLKILFEKSSSTS